ncbi:MAG: ABC transporter ATP-binding protein [Bacteroidota bacterium]
MSQPAIHITGLGKQYPRNGHRASADLRAWLSRPFRRGKPNEKELFWALKDLDLRVEPGDILGIVGRNGSGKSTLLKILSRITTPTRGEAILRGKVASLLEVGTGFHPELSGRENIYLNGVMLGMSRREVKQRFDEIVAFAGVEDSIEASVKHYSSGMYVRLAFSVAAHLRTDILLVDEVLAVGDAEFQQKSLGKMNEVVREKGRTILFVSHNLAAVRQLCHRGLLLNEGQSIYQGPIDQVITEYYGLIGNSTKSTFRFAGPLAADIQRFAYTLNGQLPTGATTSIDEREDLVFSVQLRWQLPQQIRLACAIFREGIRLTTLYAEAEESMIRHTDTAATFTLAGNQLRAGHYTIGFGGTLPHDRDQWFWEATVAHFEVTTTTAGKDANDGDWLRLQHHGKRNPPL